MSEPKSRDLILTYSEIFLKKLRLEVEESNLDSRRLPKWLDSARVSSTLIHNNIILIIEGEEGTDELIFEDSMKSDIEFFLRLPEYPRSVPTSPVNRRVRKQGEFDKPSIVSAITLDLGESDAHLVGLEYSYHQSLILSDVQVQISENNTPTATRYMPMAIYIHSDELYELSSHFENLLESCMTALERMHNSPKGDEFESKRQREEAILGRKTDSAVVFGNFDDKNKKDLYEVRDYLSQQGYDSNLIDELPAHANMSLRDKVRTWASTARFCIMVDSDASGHNNEYEILREQETILAILREENSGSSFMMPAPDMETKRRSVFEFEEKPLEVVQEAIDWAETRIKSEEETFSEYYSWR